MTPPRVLLLEDDPAVRRFVQMVLEPLGLDLVQCATLAQARQAIEAAAVQLVLTDLTLPDGSGLDWLQWLHARVPAPGLACRTVVFSGGIDPAMERQLQALQVWRILHKPASVGALMECVEQALDSLAEAAAPPPASATAVPDPVTEFFGGNHALYRTYRAACLAQFAQDVCAGDSAVQTGDVQALRRVAHNLKSVLTMLGEALAAQWARRTEECAAQGALEPMQQGWQQLRQQVLQLVSAPDGT